MQNLLTAWLELPMPAVFAIVFAFYFGTAALMVWLSFGSRLSPYIRSFKGVVAPFFGSTAIIFGLLVGFLSNDIWDRNDKAVRAVLTESDTLLALYSLGTASGTDDVRLRTAIRGYAQAVVDDEWNRLAVRGAVGAGRCGAPRAAARSRAAGYFELTRASRGRCSRWCSEYAPLTKTASC